MNLENIRQVLEDAAQTFLSAANTITSERRREAEKVRLDFFLIDLIDNCGYFLPSGVLAISSFAILSRSVLVFDRAFVV